MSTVFFKTSDPFSAAASNVVGAVTSTLLSVDLSARPIPPTMNNCVVCVQALVIGKDTTSGLGLSISNAMAFTWIAGVLAPVGSLGAPLFAQIDPSLALAALVIDASGSSVRVRGLGVAAKTISFKPFLWIWTGEYANP